MTTQRKGQSFFEAIYGDSVKNESDANKVFEDAEATKILLLNIDEINPSEENPYEITEENIENRRESIKESGLIEPLIVQKERDGKYYIISGNTRYYALKRMLGEGETYEYNKRDVTGKIPVKVEAAVYGDEKILKMIYANINRDMDKNKKEGILKRVYNITEKKISQGEYEYPKGRKQDYYAARTGFSSHFCKEWLAQNDVNGKNAKKREDKSEQDEESKKVQAEEKLYKKVRKQMQKLDDSLAEGIELYFAEHLDDEEFRELAIQIYDKLIPVVKRD